MENEENNTEEKLASDDLLCLPVIPPDDLLHSMALRCDHALGCDGYYDNPMFGGEKGRHQKRYESRIRQMRQLYEEVSGNGFYKWKKSDLA